MLLHSAISLNKGLSSSKKNTVNILHSSSHAKKMATFQLQTPAQLKLSVFITPWHHIAILPKALQQSKLELTSGYTF